VSDPPSPPERRKSPPTADEESKTKRITTAARLLTLLSPLATADNRGFDGRITEPECDDIP
jgi:hypothetical protein